MRTETLEQIISLLTPDHLRQVVGELSQRPGAACRDTVGVAALARRLAEECVPDGAPLAWAWEQSLRFSQALRCALADLPGMRYVESPP